MSAMSVGLGVAAPFNVGQGGCVGSGLEALIKTTTTVTAINAAISATIFFKELILNLSFSD
jgi:hypothetical protein